MYRRIFSIGSSAVFCWGTVAASTASACPSCQEGLAENLQLQCAYALSIGLLMGVPFLLLGGWCLALRRWTDSRLVGLAAADAQLGEQLQDSVEVGQPRSVAVDELV